VDVFRRAEDIPAHLDDMLAKKPKAVWFQSAYGTMRWRSGSPRQASRSCRTAA
jgi:predicted CoA-binding protein